MVNLRGDKIPIMHFIRGQVSNPKFMGTGNRRGDRPRLFLKAPQPSGLYMGKTPGNFLSQAQKIIYIH